VDPEHDFGIGRKVTGHARIGERETEGGKKNQTGLMPEV
jgi:hypothetical protein